VDTPSLTQVLGTLHFSETLPDRVLERLAQLATVRGFPSDAVLFREGARNEQLMIIASGRVALDMHVPGRGDVRILSLGPGDMVAWSALLGSGQMTASAVALEDTQLICMPGVEVLAICQADSAIGYHLMSKVGHALGNRLVATRLQLLDLFAESRPRVPQGPD
jgi:CRP/FNR family transcriptional regulator, cyclic AMP receptor protein